MRHWGRGVRAEDDLPDHVDVLLAAPPRLHELRSALADAMRKEVLDAA